MGEDGSGVPEEEHAYQEEEDISPLVP